jgi:Zn-dependent protease with chaperone function
METLYPSGPNGVPAGLTQPSTAYKQRAWLALASLLLFVGLYFVLAGWFVWTAYRLLGAVGGPDALMNFLVGSSAAFLALFMLKALFFVKHGGTQDAVEVTPAEQPRLFEFLYRLADEAGAPRPRRVYLSARVNAAVFYDLSILNLLFPSGKNLEIGLALVNVLTLSEMKAVLAHEFGHFAQRSMAIGSWVYIAQQIAAHVVAKRDALDKFLQFLSRVDFRIAWIGWVLSLIVWSIRSLLDTLLNLVVLAQRALSRQMEFQADLVAVSLTGSDELVHALHKLQAADDAWERTLGFTRSELQQGRIPHDLFAVQTQVIEKMKRILNDQSYGQVPQAASVKPELHRIFKAGFAQPPQMWSTHPANADREENAKRRYLPAVHDERSAWLLIDNIDAVKGKVTAHLVGETKAVRATPEQTVAALNKRYALLQYNPRYLGAYLGRSLTRHVAQPAELYQQSLRQANVQEALGGLYSEKLANDFTRLRELEEERAALQALHDKVYQATGGRIVYRGREISRRELPAAIREVRQEEDQVRQRILAHDRQCRCVHLAAAAQLGSGWREYMVGLIEILHYAEHTLADLRDAQGAFGNVFAVVTADGKVSKGELKRLITSANVLHAVLAGVHAHKSQLILDKSLCARLEAPSWGDMLEEFKLPSASPENISNWLGAVDGWVHSAATALSVLCTVTLEQLLLCENKLARHIREQTAVEIAPAPSQRPRQYPTLLPGQERKRQQRLGLWDRFQTADGFVPALARLLVAGAIVGTVLGFGSVAGTTSPLSIYNGLGRAVEVRVGAQRIALAPFSAAHRDFELSDALTIETRTTGGDLIERFSPNLAGAKHYVYNVASASPLVEWTAVYGSATKQPPRYLGAPNWLASSADVFFADAPESVKTKGGGATRLVLSGLGDRPPAEVLNLLANETQQKQVIAAHAKWDSANTPNAQEWQAIANQLSGQSPAEQ